MAKIEFTKPVKSEGPKPSAPVFKAKLDMVRIDMRNVTFQVRNKEGMLSLDFPDQLQAPRQIFSKDPDFNLDFINSTLAPDSDKRDLKKQAEWREFKNLQLEIYK